MDPPSLSKAKSYSNPILPTRGEKVQILDPLLTLNG